MVGDIETDNRLRDIDLLIIYTEIVSRRVIRVIDVRSVMTQGVIFIKEAGLRARARIADSVPIVGAV